MVLRKAEGRETNLEAAMVDDLRKKIAGGKPAGSVSGSAVEAGKCRRADIL
jgi:hypothetical protein